MSVLEESGRWIVINLDNDEKEVFEAYQTAFDHAAQMVGNRSAARPSHCLTLFGHGDGNTTVMIRPELQVRETKMCDGEGQEQEEEKTQTKPMTDEDYVAKKGRVCPYCGRTEVCAARLTATDDVAWGDAWCGDCDRTWLEQYRLVGWEPDQLEDEDGQSEEEDGEKEDAQEKVQNGRNRPAGPEIDP